MPVHIQDENVIFVNQLLLFIVKEFTVRSFMVLLYIEDKGKGVQTVKVYQLIFMLSRARKNL